MPRLPFKLRRNQIVFIFAGLIILLQSFFRSLPNSQKPLSNNLLPTSTSIKHLIKVTKVIDGDTIIIEGGRKVRYIGINAPEFYHDTNRRKTGEECFANEAYLENKRLVEGKIIRLEKDLSETDKYGRLLRYVYIPATNSGELFLNDYLILQGYARIMMVKPDTKFYPQLKQAQKEAKEENRGLWKECPSS